MHLADGVISMPVVIGTSIAAAGLVTYSVHQMREEEIPKVSLMTATFFVLALISVPIGPSSAHPLLGGLLGIVLGKRSPLAIFIGLLLQAMIFQHGGLTTLGINTLLIGIPAIVAWKLYTGLEKRANSFLVGGILGSLGVLLSVALLVVTLLLTDSSFGEGAFSVVNLLLLGHLPIFIIEFFLTGFALAFILRVRPNLIGQRIGG